MCYLHDFIRRSESPWCHQMSAIDGLFGEKSRCACTFWCYNGPKHSWLPIIVRVKLTIHYMQFCLLLSFPQPSHSAYMLSVSFHQTLGIALMSTDVGYRRVVWWTVSSVLYCLCSDHPTTLTALMLAIGTGRVTRRPTCKDTRGF